LLIAFCVLPAAGLEAAGATALSCGSFADIALAPQPRKLTRPADRLTEIEVAARTQSFPVVFLGDSLTQWWDREMWDRYFAPLPALNAGVGGDRTNHLLARLENGILDNQRSGIIVLLIGTNDLTYGRSPAMVAEGIRTVLLDLRRHLPNSLLLLEALWPREDRPGMRQSAEEVNRLISGCDGGAVLYADFGAALLDAAGQLSAPAYKTDRLHLNRKGYESISPQIRRKLDEMSHAKPAR
jgi:beta-glucosidase